MKDGKVECLFTKSQITKDTDVFRFESNIVKKKKKKLHGKVEQMQHKYNTERECFKYRQKKKENKRKKRQWFHLV